MLPKPRYSLDLRGVACPMNFVKTKLQLDKMTTGEWLEVCLDAGEAFENVSSSLKSEGHEIEISQENGSYWLLIRKVC
jgi:TusA-related sulfurtransferase